MKLFELRREEDESGVSGTGTVAQGVIFDNGKCVLTWLTPYTSVAVYEDIEKVVRIHGHNGATKIVQIADCSKERVNPLKENYLQDLLEGMGLNIKDKNHRYVWGERERLLSLFNEWELETKKEEVRCGDEG